MNISEEIKNLYKTINNSNIDKQYIITIGNKTIKNDSLVSGSVKYTDSICKNELVFGECNSSQIEFKCVAESIGNVKGTEINVALSINNNIFQFGKYIVDSCEKTENKKYRTIIAYDFISKFDVDVSTWYNGLSFPIRMDVMLASLCNYVGVVTNISSMNLINPHVELFRGMEATNLSGRDVLIAIAELNAGFFKANEKGELILKRLSNDVKETININAYSSFKTESFITKAINKLVIRQQAGDIGVSVGTGKNCYIIEDNFLIYGSETSELLDIANNIFLQIKDIAYKPISLKMRGLPYLSVGDYITIETVDGSVSSFIFNRILTGTQILTDSIETAGSEDVKTVTGIERQLIQLKGKSNVLERTIEETKQSITDIESGIESQITQTAESLESKITGITIGGRNLITNTSDEYKSITVGAYNVLPYTIFLEEKDIMSADYLTFRLYVNTKDALAGVAARITQYDDVGVAIATHIGNYIYTNSAGYTQVTALIRDDAVSIKAGLNRKDADGTGVNYSVKIKKVKLEQGNRATDWTCDPEDTNTTISNIKQSIDSIVTSVEKIDPLTTQFTEFKQDYSGFKNTVSSTYTTKEDFDNLKIGGRNLLTGTTDKATGYQMGTWNKGLKSINLSDIGVFVGDYVTFSAYLGTAGTSYVDDICVRVDQKDSNDTTISNHIGSYVKNNIGGWSKITLQIKDNCTKLNLLFGRRNGSATASAFVFTSQKEKLEKGNRQTDWTPALEDVQNEIDIVTSSYEQLANMFGWLVKSGTSQTNMVLTDQLYKLVSSNIILTAKNISLYGYTTINGRCKFNEDGTFTAGGWTTGVKAISSEGEQYHIDLWSAGAISESKIADNPVVVITGGGTEYYKLMANGFQKATKINLTTYSYPSIYGNESVFCMAAGETTNGSIRLKINSSGYGVLAPTFGGYSTTSGQCGCYLGDSDHKWKDIYSTNSVIQTSDKNEKKNIKSLGKKMTDFILKLNPVSFKFKKSESGRTHYGLIAQDVESLLSELDMTSFDFAGFIKSPKIKEIEIESENDKGEVIVKTIYEEIPDEFTYGLRYEEFIAPIIKMIQVQQEEIEVLKRDITELKKIIEI